MARTNKSPEGNQNATTADSNSQMVVSSQKHKWEELSNEKKWFLKQIKRKRTESENFIAQMRSLAVKMWEKGQPFYKQIQAIDREIHSLFDEILGQKKLSKKAKKKIVGVYQMLQFTGTISVATQPFDDSEDRELLEVFEEIKQSESKVKSEQDNNQKSQSNFDGDRTEPPVDNNQPASSKQLRHTFLRLAEVFHPDKVTDSETQSKHTEIMKELNRAYSDGDFARLLEIEKSLSEGESIQSQTDDLDILCKQLKHENELLKEQYELLKSELRQVRNTPEGRIVKEYRRAVREGIKDPISEWFSEAEDDIEELEELRDFVRDFRDKKIDLDRFLKGPEEETNVISIDNLQEMILAEIIFGAKFT